MQDPGERMMDAFKLELLVMGCGFGVEVIQRLMLLINRSFNKANMFYYIYNVYVLFNKVSV